VGEFTIVIAGAEVAATRKRDRQRLRTVPPTVEPAVIAAHLQRLRAAGLSGSAAVRQTAQELGVAKNTVYAIWLESPLTKLRKTGSKQEYGGVFGAIR
jgi:hypothetical protein